MGKLKYIFLFAIGIAIFFGCKKQAQITGLAGATGATGVPGPNYYATNNPYTFSIFPGPGPVYWNTIIFSGYNPNIDYSLQVYAHKPQVFGGQPGSDYKLPWFNVFTPGDELFSSMNRDSVILWYYSSAAWPTDSSVTFQVQIYPKQ